MNILNSEKVINIELAVLTLEDRRFYSHIGVELRAVPRLARRFLRTEKVGGISTIEQQAVRLISNRRERTIARKSKELLLAFLLNFHVGKKEIFNYYLNNSYFGWKLRGCNAASMLLFGKSAMDLTIEEAAIIAACLPKPVPKEITNFIKQHSYFESVSEFFIT